FSFVLLILLSCAAKKSVGNTEDINETEKNVQIVPSNQTNTMETVAVDPLDVVIDKKKFRFIFDAALELAPVLEKSKASGKPIYLDLNAQWCLPCKMMQRDVYTENTIADFFNENFINYMVDVEKAEGPDLKLIFDVKVIPTLLFLDYRGRVLHRYEGAAYNTELLKNARLALAKAAVNK
ncbi:MAG: thioredoxin family protein, partial [Saprospiraceae bacterium]